MAEPTAARESQRAWRVVLERIERDLMEGRLGPGDRLPSERDLSADLGVGRSSVREALRVLEVMGLIRTATGSGPQAGAIVIATPAGGLQQLLRLQVAAQGFPVADVVQTRLVLEGAVAASLATSGAPDLADAHALLDAMDGAGLSAPEFLALDAQLHLALAEASGNSVIAAMMAGLRTAIESYVREGSARIEDWAAMAERLRAEHRVLVATIEEGDAERARDLVVAHITGYYVAAGLVPDPAV
ncbi:FadR family transcriptional regulator [Microbacterium bovistercoris]|uniref:FadR family transcriptional regulator n=1 Tax=Microbacterium bovistercoris TaxID=2293570 RepID=A0A371NVT8_9MICO|nr:FCD domain-containing protein [Microbacterium bovistercoris]REJ05910.1 FadR family transcriptional regulator [Microbacterium bovistercoris]